MGKRRLLKSVTAVGLVVATMPLGALHAQQASIQIGVASWGYGATRKNVKDDVAKLCDGKPSCTFMVKNETFSGEPADPSPGDDKGLLVMWKCGDAPHKYEFAEGKKATVDCSGK